MAGPSHDPHYGTWGEDNTLGTDYLSEDLYVPLMKKGGNLPSPCFRRDYTSAEIVYHQYRHHREDSVHCYFYYSEFTP